MKNYTETLFRLGIIQDIDFHFARFIQRISGNCACNELTLAAALASNITTTEKHICLDLEAIADIDLMSLFPEWQEQIPPELSSATTPSLNTWLEKIMDCHVAVGRPSEYKPLILDQSRLYLYRLWWYEDMLGRLIKKRVSAKFDISDTTFLKRGFERYFPDSAKEEVWQLAACLSAAIKRFSVISGSPGTGKTYTVAKLLAILLEENENLKIKLCAPTGKASARLQEAIGEAKKGLNQCPESILEKIPDETFTIHRLLGYIPRRFTFRHNRNNPLLCDVLIVDEASMVPLVLLSKLLLAVPDTAKVVLLGDKDQLASVEAGAAFSDICAISGVNVFSEGFLHLFKKLSVNQINDYKKPGKETTVSDFSVELSHSFRFDSNLGIGKLAKAVNISDSQKAINVLKNDATGCLKLNSVPDRKSLKKCIGRLTEPFYKEILSCTEPEEAFVILKKLRILCSHRQGYYGAVNLNAAAEAYLAENDLILSDTLLYKGRPIIITRNDYNLRLFNGDVGIIWEDSEGFSAFFENQDKTLRRISVYRLPEYEPVYAMTVHKSQGSEFEKVIIVIPETESLILTRELIYTAITRAKKEVEIWADEDVLKWAVSRRVKRGSGLGKTIIYES